MTVDQRQPDALWREFGHHLRHWRRQAGVTQQQLGLRVGYHHSQISRLEAGLREPPVELVRRLDSALGTGGRLASIAAAPRPAPGEPHGLPRHPALFAAPPGTEDGGGPPGSAAWPSELPAEGLACPLHGVAGCAVPDRSATSDLLDALTAPRSGAAAPAEADLLHALTASLACVIRGGALHRSDGEDAATTERLLRAVLRWAAAVNSTGRLPHGQLRIAAQYAQVAGRLRMRRGQSGTGMAWFAHGLRWADAAEDAPARATLLSDSCALVRLEEDAATTLGYARALGAVDTRRRWIATLSHLHQARGHALGQDAAACRRHIALARRAFPRLRRDDHREAPWLAGAEGEMRVESAVGAALRDLAAATGDRATARRAVEAVARARTRLPPLMRDTHLLLTLRLADGWACAGDPGAAVALASPVLDEAVRSREPLIGAELDGLHGRLFAEARTSAEVHAYREMLLESALLPRRARLAGL
ncbi:helix-turn-helix domain-containing protein [Streptomyces sp. C10-9-1]|uniref:helix-turn-helix domain-containing protein n=1 Tax=Streptomyces sp. C10-9-1 TaxID=1859285 RepID=UPI002112D5B0|nr:helix-turn-helix transcriptional regulator [Streptomyces sp. C10-9-1]MCQ6554835.1 helix-turn-helix domain-containing protein [Streptomyces sp. C10-9-1]